MMTPEQFERIKERYDVERSSRYDMALLILEVERLREGIEALLDDPQPHESDRDGDGACVDTDDLTALLDPTEEGAA